MLTAEHAYEFGFISFNDLIGYSLNKKILINIYLIRLTEWF